MTEDRKRMYKTVQNEHFPPRLEIRFPDGRGLQTLYYEKTTWRIDGTEMGLRYGENPGQEAALYRLVNGNLVLGETESIAPGKYLASDPELLQSGKHPGKINLTDADNALNILRYFNDRPAAVIVKHNNPCGVALSDTLESAYAKAHRADRIAAFGGCVALNRTIDKATAEAIAAAYLEVVVGPEFEPGVMDVFRKRPNLRVIRIQNMKRLQEYAGTRFVDFKSLIDGGIILQWSFVPKARTQQDLTLAVCEHNGETHRIRREPTAAEYQDMCFGWLVETGVSSNSVIYVKNEVTAGIGTGEQDRVGVAEIARDKAYRKLADRLAFETWQTPFNELTDPDRRAEINARVEKEKGGLIGSAMVSDAFFPFRDGVDVGIREGVSAVIQPGGSVNDHQVIDACNENNVTMVFTGERSFKH